MFAPTWKQSLELSNSVLRDVEHIEENTAKENQVKEPLAGVFLRNQRDGLYNSNKE